MIDENKLLKELEIWFEYNDLTKVHFWERNKIGKLIKNNIKSIGKWKNRARGNPRKGYLEMKNKSKKINNDW